MRKIAFTILGILVVSVLGAGGIILFNHAYISGEANGYGHGYYSGERSGYDWGNKEGFTEGFDNGEKTGYKNGYETGLAVGYDSGFTEGEESGYIDGFAEGRVSGFDEGYSTGYTLGMNTGMGHGYTVKDPTYAEALAFMRQDTTNENEYNEADYGIYVCSHFSRDTCNNAEDVGLRSALIELRYPDSGHTLIGFNTVDRGMVYFEPQTDELVSLEIGKRYYRCVVPAPGNYYTEPEYDDTIRDILVIW